MLPVDRMRSPLFWCLDVVRNVCKINSVVLFRFDNNVISQNPTKIKFKSNLMNDFHSSSVITNRKALRVCQNNVKQHLLKDVRHKKNRICTHQIKLGYYFISLLSLYIYIYSFFNSFFVSIYLFFSILVFSNTVDVSQYKHWTHIHPRSLRSFVHSLCVLLVRKCVRCLLIAAAVHTNCRWCAFLCAHTHAHTLAQWKTCSLLRHWMQMCVLLHCIAFTLVLPISFRTSFCRSDYDFDSPLFEIFNLFSLSLLCICFCLF